jgi:hypothetical protein
MATSTRNNSLEAQYIKLMIQRSTGLLAYSNSDIQMNIKQTNGAIMLRGGVMLSDSKFRGRSKPYVLKPSSGFE